MNPSDQISIRQAYVAMYQYLKRIYDLTGSDELGGLLGSMSLLPDGQPADPAAWSFSAVPAPVPTTRGQRPGALSHQERRQIGEGDPDGVGFRTTAPGPGT